MQDHKAGRDRLAQASAQLETELHDHAELKSRSARELQDLRRTLEAEVAELKRSRDHELADARRAHEAEVSGVRKALELELSESKRAHETEVSEVKKSHEAEQSEVKKALETELQANKAAAHQEVGWRFLAAYHTMHHVIAACMRVWDCTCISVTDSSIAVPATSSSSERLRMCHSLLGTCHLAHCVI